MSTEGMYQVAGVGSAKRCTTYDMINDRVMCGCWDDENGNTLESFIKRVKDTYGQDKSNRYYRQYMSAIKFFKSMKEINDDPTAYKH